MADTLVIVESPAKAKTIGKFLGSKYKVVASNGHVRDLPKSQLGVDPDKDFEPKYITLRGRGDVLETIRREAKEANRIFLATDPDREGEAISWHLSKILHIDEGSKCRIEFNEITANAIKNSIKKVRQIDMRLVDAQQTRRILDRLVGYKISPVLWAKVRKGLSAGRVQSVATRIICDREDEINAFIPEEYWTISALLPAGRRKPFEAKYFGENGKKRELRSKEDADSVLSRIRGRDFVVSEITEAEKSRHAAPPFTTSSLQQDASRKLGFTTKRTMMVAQQLYEGISIGKTTTGLISYIRTDSVRVASEAQDAARDYILSRYGAEYVPGKPNVYKGRRGAQDAHEAIRPTNIELEPKDIREHLSPDQYKLYKLVYERFLASQMSESKYLATSVSFDVNGCTFRAYGNRTLFDGFSRIYTEGKDEEDENGVQLPTLSKDERLAPIKIDSQQRFTQPPPRYTEAMLVKTLEEKGIGRPSTYSPTISTIVDRGYVSREKKTLAPTDLGFIVTRLMKENFGNIVDVGFTADMEERLDKIEDGNMNWRELLREFYPPFMESVTKASDAIEKVKIPDEVSDIPCEKCGALMVYKTGRFGRFLACPNFPECRNTKPITEKIDVKCPKCGAAIIKRKSKRGKAFYGCERYPDCDFVSWDRPVGIICPKCGSMMVQKMSSGGGFIRCSNENCKHVYREAKKSKSDE
ncbi:MAG: type I DNA topoisomerase [Clostridia bacterium]|nr:type I DNA topoisomerase [Clostridia bacterium]